MKKTLIAVSAGAGTFRIPAFVIQRMPIPMVTALFIDDQWVPFIDGESLAWEYKASSPSLAFHRCIANYMHRNNCNHSFIVELEEAK